MTASVTRRPILQLTCIAMIDVQPVSYSLPSLQMRLLGQSDLTGCVSLAEDMGAVHSAKLGFLRADS